jgi:hypothetical protein
MEQEACSLEESIQKLSFANAKGIACAEVGNFDSARNFFEDGLKNYALAERSSLSVPVDWHAVLTAGAAYVARMQGKEKEKILEKLVAALQKSDSKNIRDCGPINHFGRARLLEEAGLVWCYNTENPANFERAKNLLEEALCLYQLAEKRLQEDNSAEIFGFNAIKDKRLRVTGLVATCYAHLAEATGGETKDDRIKRVCYAEKAIASATAELHERTSDLLNSGQQPDAAYQNALHTAGVAHTLFAEEDRHYDIAKTLFEAAQKITNHPSAAMVSSVIDFRLAWLEYVRDPENNGAQIEEYFGKVIDSYDTEGTSWPPAVRNLLAEKWRVLIDYIAKRAGEEIENG